MKKSLIATTLAAMLLISGCAPTAEEPPGDGPATTQPAAPSTEASEAASTAPSSVAPSSTQTPTASADPTALHTPEPPSAQSTEVPVPTAAPTPEAPVASPTSETAPEPSAGETVTPNVEWGVATITVRAGSSFTIIGAGYEPGQRISVSLGVAQSDFFIFRDESAFADTAGNYSFTITIAADLEPRTYAVVTSTPDDMEPVPAGPDTRRWATIEVVAP